MTPEDYLAAKTVAVAAALQAAARTASMFARTALTPLQWMQLLEFVYPEVQRRRTEVASLARDMYDTERARHYPTLPRNERPLEGTDFQRFVWSMEPARKTMSQEDSPQNAVTHFAMRVAREIENAGRNQIINAVDNDPDIDELLEIYLPDTETVQPAAVTDLTEFRERKQTSPSLVKGWARVATGRETCAWCLMLISRGPVYHGAVNAGLRLDDETAIDAFEDAGQDLEAFREYVADQMDEWHTGCDCVVVPVFDVANWPGFTAQQDAERIWIDASKEASRLMGSGESRTQNRYKETLNELRRRLYHGDVSVPSYVQAA